MGLGKPKIAELRKPQFYNLNGQTYLLVPILNEDKKDKAIGADYVIEFPVTSKGPSRQAKVVYRAPNLGEPWPITIHHAWEQAYAVWKNSLKKVGATR